ncbi:MAG TPA: Gfo/Idh/MocA family oxidoreductase [Bryobacterales bacterium]|nr:Gfo/Idh/MocA family oxidoreductase [Bryobacterales bacterium]
MSKIRVAVIGAGEFGRHHARVLHELPEAELVAVADSDPARARDTAARFGVEALTNYRDLAGRIDAATVAAPTSLHAEIGAELLSRGIDVLVEKPIAADLESADRLLAAARDHGRILRVGHLERFNPAVEAAAALARLPLFFEVHRMSVFTPRSLDIDVVLDLMIHDLDIVLSLVRSEIQQIHAVGLPVLSSRADIAHVRLQFANGCVANLTASRVSTEKIRKLRFFQPRQYVSVDYSRQDGAVFSVSPSKQIAFEPLPVVKGEPLQREMAAFLEAVKTRAAGQVSGEDGRKALAVALRIVEEMDSHARIVAATIAGQGC